MPPTTTRDRPRPSSADPLRLRSLATSLQAVYIPDEDGGGRLLLWAPGTRRRGAGEVAGALELLGAPVAAAELSPGKQVLRLPGKGRNGGPELAERMVRGHELSHAAVSALARLTAGPGGGGARPSGSLRGWSLAVKLGLELVAREQVTPVLVQVEEGHDARWAVVLSRPEDRSRLAALASGLPPAAHARPAPGPPGTVWRAEALLRAFLDDFADAAMRAAGAAAQAAPAALADPAAAIARQARRPRHARRAGGAAGSAADSGWERRLVAALVGPRSGAAFEALGVAERGVVRELEERVRPLAWAEREAGGARACFRLESPGAGDDAWQLDLLLQAEDDPGLLVDAADVWRARGQSARLLGRVVREPQERLAAALAEAARVFPPLAGALREARPTGVTLDADEAWSFLSEAAPVLDGAGFGVLLPEALTAAGERRLRARLRVGAAAAGSSPQGGPGLGLDGLVSFRWEAAVGDEALTEAEFRRIAREKRPLVLWRGRWLVVDPRELERLERRFRSATGELGGAAALAAALSGSARLDDGAEVEVVTDGPLATLIDTLRHGAAAPAAVAAPAGFRGELRPYQARGVGWLAGLARLGLGGVLADDMGLGKTIQLIALVLHERFGGNGPDDGAAREGAAREGSAREGSAREGSAREGAGREGGGPTLVVCPTSVLGNWEHETERFAPSLRVVRHHGPERERREKRFARLAAAADVVLTTYGTARRDAALLGAVAWRRIALDEAQNIKNPESRQARVARSLPARQKVALSGTPVENRLDELWSVLDFANPGLLGPRDAFQRRVAAPIERYGDPAAAAALRRLTAPFVLRRMKTDPAVAGDLPAKQELKVWCTLTPEQAALYQTAVDEAMAAIEAADGIERRGKVLALLTALKQICNHPAQYLGEPGPLHGRSGKLARLAEMLAEVAAAGEYALVFTQYREMGDRLVGHLEPALGQPVPFLHGGVPRKRRDAMVERFQRGDDAPTAFVLSLRAGGVGLNLTRANHVFHYDRWWNPAVEDQATDRAFRIGQRRDVQVHKLVTLATLEERIDELLERKRALADAVIGHGEAWLTELSDDDLRRLVVLGRGAALTEED